MSESLRNKTVRGVGWSFADSFLGQGITFVVGLVLARLLTPDEYGLIGIITIFITVLNSIVDSGFSNALIRKKDVTDNDYNTVFITNLVFSIVLFVAMYLSAPVIALFFHEEELVGLTRVMSVIVIINALSLVQNTILTKKIDFKTKTKASLISAVISGIIGIGVALSGFGVWALVLQAISKQLFYTLCLWVFNKWWPRLFFSWQSFKEMWSFGWKLLVSSFINTIWNELYQIVVGKFYSPATLGQYSRAKQFATIFSSNLNTVVQRVSFPALSEIQNDKSRLKEAYRKVIKTTMFVTAILMFFLGAISEPLIFCLIGPQWREASRFLPLICVAMSLYPLHSINLNMLQVQGRSDLFLKLELIKKSIAVGPILLGVFVGIYWMLIGSIITGIVSYFFNSYYSGKFLDYTSYNQLKDIAPSYGVATLIALSIYPLKFLQLSSYLILPIQFVIGVGVFLASCYVFDIKEYKEVRGILLNFINKEN